MHEQAMTETAQLADLILPTTSFVEQDGTVTSCERRVQKVYKAFESSSEIKSDWLIFTEVSAQLGADSPYFSARDIFREIVSNVPQYKGLTLKDLGESGVRW